MGAEIYVTRGERYYEAMNGHSSGRRRLRATAATLCLGLVVAGCGSGGPPVISHNMRPAEVEQKILDRLSGWQSTAAHITETYQTAGGPVVHYQLQLVTQASPPAYYLRVSSQGTPAVTWVSDGQETVRYQAGAAHYLLSTEKPWTTRQRRVLGVGLASLIRKSRLQSVQVKGNQVALHLITPITSGTTAHATLWFDLTTNTPLKWQAQWPGGSVLEVPSRFQVNPSLTPSRFAFVPPQGVTPEVLATGTAQGSTDGQPIQGIPIVLPPSMNGLALDQVTTGVRQGHEVVMMTFTDGQGNPVLVTESQGGILTRPSGVTLTQETFGSLTVLMGALPLGADVGLFRVGRTSVEIEGPGQVVDVLVTDWGNASLGSSSP